MQKDRKTKMSSTSTQKDKNAGGLSFGWLELRLDSDLFDASSRDPTASQACRRRRRRTLEGFLNSSPRLGTPTASQACRRRRTLEEILDSDLFVADLALSTARPHHRRPGLSSSSLRKKASPPSFAKKLPASCRRLPASCFLLPERRRDREMEREGEIVREERERVKE